MTVYDFPENVQKTVENLKSGNHTQDSKISKKLKHLRPTMDYLEKYLPISQSNFLVYLCKTEREKILQIYIQSKKI